MGVIPAPPGDVRETKVYQLLLEKSLVEDGLAEKMSRLIQIATPLLDLIVAGPFREYTLHNRDHAKKVLHLMGYLVSEQVLRDLSNLECALLIASAYVHDLGMCLTSTEQQRYLESPEFVDYVHEWTELDEALGAARRRALALTSQQANGSEDDQNQLDAELFATEAEIFQLQEAALAAFLRPRHATRERYIDLISLLETQAARNDLFSLKDVSFKEVLIEICVSHNLKPEVLVELKDIYEDVYPRDLVIAGERVNVQFCAALLRLADVLDFDRERTPRVLFESLGIAARVIPGADVSLKEWEKHLAVHTLEIQDDEIVVSATTHHPVIESAIRDFCSYIEQEIRDTTAVLRRNPPQISEKYTLDLPLIVRPRIRSIGYVFKDMAFRLNQISVLSLLMGERLYSTPAAAVRELVQNAVDACRARGHLDPPTYKPEVSVSSDVDDNGKVWLQVADNGLGMDEFVLSEYFFQVGSSYYQSTEFSRLMRSAGKERFIPVSRFGIGIISVFMIADHLEVVTCNLHSPRLDNKGRRLRVSAGGGLAFVTEDAVSVQGTIVRIRLRATYSNDEFIGLLANYLRQVVVRPGIKIHVALGPNVYDINERELLAFRMGASDFLKQKGLEAIRLDLDRWSDSIISGVAVVFFARREGDLLSNLYPSGQTVTVKQQDLIREIFENYVGNRVTVNGFRMTLKKGNRVLGRSVPVVYDIEVTGREQVEYDVAREKLTGPGLLFVKKVLRSAVIAGLKELGVLERLLQEASSLLPSGLAKSGASDTSRSVIMFEKTKDISEELLRAVELRLPNNQFWPRGIHKEIAQDIGASNQQVSHAINRLLKLGRVQKPRDTPSEE